MVFVPKTHAKTDIIIIIVAQSKNSGLQIFRPSGAFFYPLLRIMDSTMLHPWQTIGRSFAMSLGIVNYNENILIESALPFGYAHDKLLSDLWRWLSLSKSQM